MNDRRLHIAIVGLGYVGWPLLKALAQHHHGVLGLDTSNERLHAIHAESDRPANIQLTSDPADLEGRNLFIIAVPTPLAPSHQPDLRALKKACASVGSALKAGATVILEVTVSPGTIDQLCIPQLEQSSQLKSGTDFHVGYAPERMNPGDREHTLSTVARIIAAPNPTTRTLMKRLYGTLNGDQIVIAPSIRHAEAAKLVENAQRDVNIAFANEMSTVLHTMGMDASSVFALAASKWNFLPFRPGLVGGHCISVDPWYLIDAAHRADAPSPLVKQARNTNDRYPTFIAQRILNALSAVSHPKVLILGLTYKADIDDCRNSRIFDVMETLRAHDLTLHSFDPLVDPVAVDDPLVRATIVPQPIAPYHAIVVGAAHQSLKNLDIPSLLTPPRLMIDIPSAYPQLADHRHIAYWQP